MHLEGYNPGKDDQNNHHQQNELQFEIVLEYPIEEGFFGYWGGCFIPLHLSP
jgi:hypothetical protein